MNTFGPAELDRFRAVIARRMGLQFDDGKMNLLANVLRQRLDALGRIGADAYLSSLGHNGADQGELRALASRLTVAETYFFRGADHFQALAELVLPERMHGRDAHRPLRLLSAGCASGEEAYSLAMLLRERFPEILRSDVRIVGIDINPVMLAKAREARYSAWSLRETLPEIRDRYFHAENKSFVLDESIRSMVSFEERNIAGEEQALGDSDRHDVIFCRNVIMYFVPDAVQRVVARLTRALAPAGYLFLSHAETLRGLSQDFHLRHTRDAFYYQKRGESEALPEPPRTADSVLPMDSIDVSWVDAVRHASERIESLSRNSGKRTTAASAPDAREGESQHTGARLSFAFELLRQERFHEALEALDDLPPKTAADCDAQLLRAVLLTNCGDVPAARAVCEQVLSLDDLSAGAHYLTALCCEHGGDRNGAAEHDRAAIYLDPAFAMPHLHLGLLAKRSGELATARRELEVAGMLLLREDTSRILLLGGGFSREALLKFSRAELRACGGGI